MGGMGKGEGNSAVESDKEGGWYKRWWIGKRVGRGGYIKGKRKRVCTLKNGCEILCKSMVVCL